MTSINASSSNCSSQENLECIYISEVSLNYTVFLISSVLVMFPVCVLVLYLGLRQWWQRRFLSAAAPTSHSDVFICHLVVIELVGVVGGTLCFVDIQAEKGLFTVGLYLWNFPWYGEALFHILTCVEHYLAVVHPITYLSSKTERGIRIRNICIGCVWLLCFILTGLIPTKQINIMASFLLAIFSMLVVSFCCISVLYNLIRPGPGDKPGSGRRSDQSKMKAFYIVMLILGVVSLRFLCNISWMVFYFRSQTACQMVSYLVWFNLPCSLILPLLFLQRSGTLPFCMSKASE